MKTAFILCLLSLCLSSTSHGQEGKMFTVDKDLSSSMLNKIYQDRDGIIWIATEDGLNRYDGAKFTVYRNEKSNPHSLLNDYVRTLYEDKQGRLFIGSLNGLQIYDRATASFTTIPMYLSSGASIDPNIATILERNNGEILIGTSGHSMFLLETRGDSIKARQISRFISSNLITYAYEDRKGNLWIATGDNGIFRFDKNNQSKHYSGEKDIAKNTVSSMCEDKQGNLYMSSLKKGLFIYDDKKDVFIPFTDTPNPDLPIKILYPGDQNEIFIGTDGSGMKVYDTQEQKIKEANFNITTFNLKKAKVHSILKDKIGNIWLGFFQKGVMIIPATTNEFKYMGYKSSVHNVIGSNCVMSVYKDHTGTLWVGTDNDGIYAIAPDNTLKAHFTPTDDPHSVPATIMSIFEDSNYNLWIGSYLHGMTRLDPKTGRCEYLKLSEQPSNLTENIYCFAEDDNKTLWIGTMGGGLFYMDINTRKVVRCPMLANNSTDWTKVNMLHNSWINSLLYTNEGKLYIGTYDGLGCVDIKTMDFISPLRNRRILYGDVIYALHEGSDGSIWIGTSKGLKHLNPKSLDIREYTIEDGLPSNYICAIKEDVNGYLWISTNYGISRFNPKNQSFINFYASDGLQGNEFSKGASFAYHQSELIFGGTNGITYFNPAEITNSSKKPEIRITDFYIHDKMVKKGMESGGKDIVTTAVMDADHFQLSHKDNSFSIEFSAMEFFSPERITYIYRINHTSWISLQQGINRVSFSNLSPGDYTFQIKAKDNDSYSDIKEIRITIDPAWYASGWAKLMYGILLIAIIYIIVIQVRHRYRARQEILEHIHAEQINEAKLQFFINISHEIRTPMSLIISPLQKLISTDKDGERQKNYHTIYRNAERILRLVNQLMDIRKIDKGQMSLKFQEIDIVGFIRDLYYTFEYQANAKHITLCFQTEMENLQAWIDPKNFDKVILNIISNAFKFTPENGKINIYLRTGKDMNAPCPLQHYFEIIIEDSGIGIDPAEIGRIFERFYQIRNSHNNSNVGTGIGLHLSRSLIELHHGTIEAENNEGKPGSRFIIRLPLGKEHLNAEEIDNNPTDNNSPVHITTALPTSPVDEEDEKIRSRTKNRVLVVEDDEEIRKYICRELASDFHMSECTNGKEALAMILKKEPDLIISDIIMPEMDGLTLCKKIKQNVTINHIPIILLTAKSREEDNLEGLNMGADAYIVKPFSIEILRKTAINLIKSREVLRNSFSGSQMQEQKLKKLKVQSPDDRLLDKVMKVINDNLGNPDLNVEMIATEVGISRVHLHRKLKELTNQSTRDLIRNVRLKQAASLLANQYHNITEVASLTGFTNIAYFSTAFKELYGVPPTSYMEEQQKSSFSDGDKIEQQN